MKIKFRLIWSMNLNYVCFFFVFIFWKYVVIKLLGNRFLEGKINDIIKNKYLKMIMVLIKMEFFYVCICD